jgi:hypothetical protein
MSEPHTATIFIQIASYRDPELLPTIRDCIKNAEYPERLKFCICWQRAEEDSMEEFINDPRFIILSVPYQETKGCCWARNKIQQYYNNENYTLQLDSHHRFVHKWDSLLINMITKLQTQGHKKPLITTYVPSYNPENDPEERVQVPWKINFDRATEDGQILFRPAYIDNFKELSGPLKAQFYSAHFAFTLGIFCKEVQHDPELYFTGEEMNITIRAYTNGYDLFHPHIVIVWHEYTRKNRTKHWDDDKEWWKKDLHSKNHYKLFFEKIKEDNTNNSNTIYNIGKERSIYDYINQTNIDVFKMSKVTETETEPKLDKKESNIIEISETNTTYKTFDESWRNWMKENQDLGITKQTIRDILLKAPFDPEDIEKELLILFVKNEV